MCLMQSNVTDRQMDTAFYSCRYFRFVCSELFPHQDNLAIVVAIHNCSDTLSPCISNGIVCQPLH